MEVEGDTFLMDFDDETPFDEATPFSFFDICFFLSEASFSTSFSVFVVETIESGTDLSWCSRFLLFSSSWSSTTPPFFWSEFLYEEREILLLVVVVVAEEEAAALVSDALDEEEDVQGDVLVSTSYGFWEIVWLVAVSFPVIAVVEFLEYSFVVAGLGRIKSFEPVPGGRVNVTMMEVSLLLKRRVSRND
jgi:hypothetical protein